MAQAVPLEYGRHSRRRLPVVRILLALVLGAMAYFGWNYRKAIQDRYHMYSLQRQCMNYTGPADLIVYERDEIRGNELIKRDPAYHQNYYHQSVMTGWWPMEGTYRTVP